MGALTIGAARRVVVWKGFDAAVGAEGTLYAVPGALRASHGRRPLSFQVFVRVRLPTGGTGRMWNMVMSRGHGMAGDEHAGHVVR